MVVVVGIGKEFNIFPDGVTSNTPLFGSGISRAERDWGDFSKQF